MEVRLAGPRTLDRSVPLQHLSLPWVCESLGSSWVSTQRVFESDVWAPAWPLRKPFNSPNFSVLITGLWRGLNNLRRWTSSGTGRCGPSGWHWAGVVSDLGGGPDEGSHQQGGVQGVLPTLHEFLHPSPALQHCAKQVLCPGAPEHLHLLTQSCLLWAGSGVRE